MRWGGKRCEPPHALLFSVSSRPAKCAPFRALLCASAARDAGWGEISCFLNYFNEGVNFNTFLRLNRFIHFEWFTSAAVITYSAVSDAKRHSCGLSEATTRFTSGKVRTREIIMLNWLRLASLSKYNVVKDILCSGQVTYSPLAKRSTSVRTVKGTKPGALRYWMSVQCRSLLQCFYWHHVCSGKISSLWRVKR